MIQSERGRSLEAATVSTPFVSGIPQQSLNQVERRVNAVPPMHHTGGGDTRFLHSLMKEMKEMDLAAASSTQSTINNNDPPPYDEAEARQKMMLEKYKQEVRAQQGVPPPTWQMATSAHLDWNNRGPPPTQPSMSLSQPCLINIDKKDHPTNDAEKRRLAYTRGHSTEQSCLMGGVTNVITGMTSSYGPPSRPTSDHSVPPTTPTKNGPPPSGGSMRLLQSLREENSMLRQKMESLMRNNARLQLLEAAQQRIEKEYELLLAEKERAEALEKTNCNAMETQIEKLLCERECLLERLSSSVSPSHLEQYNKLTAIASAVAHENEQLKSMNERNRMEMQSQTVTLDEQRRHIRVLEKAVATAQEKANQSEKMIEEMNERDRVVQRLLRDTITDKKAREEVHVAERAQMEKELAQLKMHINKDNSMVGGLKKPGPSMNGDDQVIRLKKELQARIDRIFELENDLTELQKKKEDVERTNIRLKQNMDEFNHKIRELEEEKSDRDRRIAELTEVKERLVELLGDEEEEEALGRDLNRMEKIRQRIQERKRINRPLGGLCTTRILHRPPSPHSHPSAPTPPSLSSHPPPPSIITSSPSFLTSSKSPRLPSVPPSSDYQHLYMYSQVPLPYPVPSPSVDPSQYHKTREADL